MFFADHLKLFNILYFLSCCVGIYIIFYFLYRKENVEYINFFDSIYSKIEQKVVREMLTRYIIWGAFQQISIIAMVYFIPVEDIVKTILAIILFTPVHFPNKPLMIVTFFLGVSIYIPFFMYDMNILIYYALMHAFAGTLYNFLGWDMNVLWAYYSKNKS